MSRTFTNIFIPMAIIAGVAIDAVAAIGTPSQLECDQNLVYDNNSCNGVGRASATGSSKNNIPKLNGIILSPDDGSIKKSLSSIEVLIPTPNYYIQAVAEQDNVSSVVFTSDKGTEIHAVSYGETNYPYVDGKRYTSFTIEFPKITEDGVYNLNVPEGLITMIDYSTDRVNGTPVGVNPEITASYTIDSTKVGLFENYSLNPEPETGVITLNGIRITFPEIAADANINANYGTISATNGDVSYTGHVRIVDDSKDCMVIEIYFMKGWEQPTFDSGTWTVTIQKDTFTYMGESNDEIVAEYFVIAKSDVSLALEETFPVNESKIKQLNVINLLYKTSEGATIKINKDLFNNIDLMVNYDKVYVDFEEGKTSNLIEGMVNIPLIIEDPYGDLCDGDYEISLPEGLFYEVKYDEETEELSPFEGYKASGPVSLYFTVNSQTAGMLEKYTLSPESSEVVASLEEISISFDNVPEYLSVNRNLSSYDEISLTNDYDDYVGWPSIGSNPIRIEFCDDYGDLADVSKGNWTLTIPAGYFMFDGEESPEIVANYTVVKTVGINAIDPDEKVTVFTPDGRTLIKNASEDALKNLEKGLYIVNGKKIIIKN